MTFNYGVLSVPFSKKKCREAQKISDISCNSELVNFFV